MRPVILLATAHLCTTVTTFLLFGLGLEGPRSAGHDFLWMLLLPGTLLPGPWYIILPLNSLLWGMGGAVILKLLHRLIGNFP